VIVLGPVKHHPLVEMYRCPVRLLKAIPHHDQLVGLPRGPFVGEATFGEFVTSLREQRRWMTRTERIVTGDLIDYLTFKTNHPPDEKFVNQSKLPFLTTVSSPSNEQAT
jgi:hypothetical protein